MQHSLSTTMRNALWIALVTLATVLFSFALACAAPFAALAAVAAVRMARGPGLLLILAAWGVNQAIGFLLLDYPTTWDSFAWGAAIGLAALLATLASRRIAVAVETPAAQLPLAFAVAFVVYELALYLPTFALPSGDETFSFGIVFWVLQVNVLAFAGLLVLHWFAGAVGLLAPRPSRLAAGV